MLIPFKFSKFTWSTMTRHLISLYSILALFLICVNDVLSYRPVVMIHGVMAGSDSMQLISERIQDRHPGTLIHNTARYEGWKSLEPMWHQVEKIGQDIIAIGAAFPDGINLLGYSQGGLLARAILQRFPQHNVRTFISLSSPQAGQYGTQFLHLFFPDLVCETAYELFYSIIGQHTSVGNYWNDPYHQKLYFKYSKFLPYVNNEKLSTNTSQFKDGLTKLQQLVMIGGPDDGVITPWQSSQFGYFVNDSVVEMRDRDIYKTDAIGLKTLDKAKKLTTYSIPGIPHKMWHVNVTILEKYILPHLD